MVKGNNNPKNKRIYFGFKKYLIDYYYHHKIISLIIVVLLLLLFISLLPVYPSQSEQSATLNIAYTQNNNGFPEQQIVISESCDTLSNFNGFGKVTYTGTAGYSSPNGEKITPIAYNFRKYNITIYALNVCNSCIDDNTLSVSEKKTCRMNQSVVLGYIEECQQIKGNYNSVETKCNRQPFTTSNDLEIVYPEGNFKMSFEPYVTKTKISNGNFYPVINTYSVKIIITYPDKKALPYVPRVIDSVTRFILSPIESCLDIVKNKWKY